MLLFGAAFWLPREVGCDESSEIAWAAKRSALPKEETGAAIISAPVGGL